MGQKQTVEKMWEDENSLTIEQRRKRYNCGEKYLTDKELIEKYRWDLYKEVYAQEEKEEKKEQFEQQKNKEEKEEEKNKDAQQIETLEDIKDSEQVDEVNSEPPKEIERELTHQEKKMLKIKEEMEKEDLNPAFEIDLELNKKIVLYRGDICSLEVVKKNLN